MHYNNNSIESISQPVCAGSSQGARDRSYGVLAIAIRERSSRTTEFRTLCGGNKRVGGDNHLIARANVEPHKGHMVAVGPRADHEIVMHVVFAFELLFEIRGCRTQHNRSAFDHVLKCGSDRFSECIEARIGNE